MLYRCRGFFMLSGGTYGGVVGTILCLIQMLQNCVTNIKILSFKICKKPVDKYRTTCYIDITTG